MVLSVNETGKNEVNIFMKGLESFSFFSFHEHNLRQQINMNLIHRHTDYMIKNILTNRQTFTQNNKNDGITGFIQLCSRRNSKSCVENRGSNCVSKYNHLRQEETHVPKPKKLRKYFVL
jgi:hypothetical protein